MEKTNTLLHKTNRKAVFMNFFDGLFFSMSGSAPNNRAAIHNEPLYYGIQFNYRGPVRLRVNGGREYRAEGPHAFLTYPGADFEYGAVDGIPRHHNFICTCGDRIARYLESGLMNLSADPPLIHIRNPERFLQTMFDIMALTRLPGPAAPRAVLMFEDLLLQLHESAEARSKPPPFQTPYLNALIEKICANPSAGWNFAAEAEKCHVTPTHFRRLFKELTGMPPQQFLIQNRLRKAASLLIHTQDSVKRIADLAGMENAFYFSRIFRKKYHISPLEYRREFNARPVS